MRSRFTPTLGWACIAVFVLLFNFTSPPGQTLSECADVWIKRHPVLARLFVVVLAAHIGNFVSNRVDLIHLFFTLRRPRV